jgi:hypothetical protein
MQDNHSEEKKDVSGNSKGVSRRNILKRGGLATGLTMLASAFSLAPFSPAQAATTPASDLQVTDVEGQEATRYLQQVLKSQDYQHFGHLVQREYAGILSIQEHASSVLRITDKQNTLIIVRIPVAGGEGHSHYVATFLPGSFSILQTQSALFTLTAEKNVVALAERNGQVVAEATFTPQGDVSHGYMYNENGVKTNLDGVSLPSIVRPFSCGKPCAESCFGDYGIEFGVASLVLAICTGVCLSLATPLAPAALVGCVACIVGLTGYDTGVITYCIVTCWC